MSLRTGLSKSGSAKDGETFVLKDSPPELIAAAKVPPKGRTYTSQYAKQPGGILVDDIALGMKLASVAITDDDPDTLKNVSKSNPWHAEALRAITGSEEAAHQPLTNILTNTFGLETDTLINISKWKAGYALDTQGYIAHNDTTIVLAYRCTTSFKDWMTNLTTTSSEWEPDVDIALGHSGWCSCLDGLCKRHKPRVHTGFYNNFIASAPLVEQHIDPLLAPDQPPRKLYVVGHSLGAGVATMAACYFLLEHDWEKLPHKLVVITAGGPRACKQDMRDLIQEKMAVLRPLDKAVICRLVRDKDVVPSVPPAWMGFAHLDKLVYISREGEILINPSLNDDHVITAQELEKMEKEKNADLDGSGDVAGDGTEGEEKSKVLTDYEKKMRLIPRPLRDHCPDYYLAPLVKLFERENEGQTAQAQDQAQDQAQAAAGTDEVPVSESFAQEGGEFELDIKGSVSVEQQGNACCGIDLSNCP